MEKERMPGRFGMQNDVIGRNHASGHGLHDHLVRTAKARRRQAETIARGLHRVWTNARQILARLMNGTAREPKRAANGERVSRTLGRASLADAFRRDRERLAEAFRHFILEPYARRRRRRIAIAQLRTLDDRVLADIGVTRGQIELAVDGMLARRDQPPSRPAGRPSPAEEGRHELPRAA
jgi:uncharacterized protein YjiS (DUF1127 family)